MISNTTDGKLVSDLSAENGSANDQEELKLSDLTSADSVEESPTNNTGDAQNNSRAAILPVDTEDKAKLNSQKSILKPGEKKAIVKKKTATFKTFRSSNHLDSPTRRASFKLNFDNKSGEVDEDARAEALVRAVIKKRRMKKILKAKLDSLRVQENIIFARKHNLDTWDLGAAKTDIENACTQLVEPFVNDDGPLNVALRKVRSMLQDMQFIEDLESEGIASVMNMLHCQLNDLEDERNSKRYQIQYANSILRELEEDAEAEEDLRQTNLLNAKKTEHTEAAPGTAFMSIMQAAKQQRDDNSEAALASNPHDIPTKVDDGEEIDMNTFTPLSQKPSSQKLYGLT
eukprot:g7578.t1